ncbi:MAG: hypothetical protein KF844_06075 [Cryobacterium sp.]|nr:hypothetical protein [Cryobacterium sp.]
MARPKTELIEQQGQFSSFSALKTLVENIGSLPERSWISKLFGVSLIPRSLRGKYQAALGEVSIPETLANLGDNWASRHAVQTGESGGVIDHIVAGPAGVFTFNVQQLSGHSLWIGEATAIVDGERMPLIRESEFQSVRVAQLMSDAMKERIEVTPCLIAVDPRSVTVARPPKKVAVLTQRELRQWLRDLPTTLEGATLSKVLEKVSDDSTWGSKPDSAVSIDSLLGKFRAIRNSVNQARRLRMLWIAGVLILVWLASILVAGAIAGT